jgi:hypothetical protein
LNPAHRLHRVPAGDKHQLGDVVPDAVEVVEAMIGDLLRVYPGAEISLHKEAVSEAEVGAEGSSAEGGSAQGEEK